MSITTAGLTGVALICLGISLRREQGRFTAPGTTVTITATRQTVP